MANEVSWSMSRNGEAISTLANGTTTVTEGVAAPGAGDIEVRIASTITVPWTKLELKNAMDTLWRAMRASAAVAL